MRSKNRQLLPEPNDKYMQVPGRQGSILFPGGLADRRIEIDCAFRGNKLPDLRIRAREIAAWLYTENREILRFDDESEKYYRGKLAQAIDFEHLAVMGQFSLIFVCEPLAYGEKQEVSFINDSATVLNMGTYKAKPSFDIDLMGDTSEIKINKDTDYIRVVHSFKAGDKLHIADGKVLINGTRAMDKLDWQYSRFFDLPVGESVLNITPLGKCLAKVKYTPRWL